MLKTCADCSFIIDSWEKKEPQQKPKFTLKAEKVFWTLKGAYTDGYTNKEVKVEKKKKIVNNKHLSLINLFNFYFWLKKQKLKIDCNFQFFQAMPQTATWLEKQNCRSVLFFSLLLTGLK